MKPKITLLFFFIFLISIVQSSAQKDDGNKLTNPKEDENTFKKFETQQNSLDNINTENLSVQLGVDKETAKELISLKNPFLPQIPRPKIENPVEAEIKEPAQKQEVFIPTPPKKQEQIKPDFKISGLIWNTDKPQGILNGKIVQTGDTVENWKVTEINKNGIKVEFEGYSLLVEPKKLF